MKTELLLGDEAVALGAIHAGIGGAFSYPGTPATEIFEFIQQRCQGGGRVSALWSANEKVAYEEGLGMSHAGKRALVSMKHVGLNVAADPFMSSALTGAHAGFVLAVADDPGMHSSQNEQDSRFFGDFARIPVFEPANQQEAYDLTRAAFELSEDLHLPVMLRLVTRLAHSRAIVRVVTPEPLGDPEQIMTPPDRRHWTLLPVNARRRFRRLIDVQEALLKHSESTPANQLRIAGKVGIIACGIASNYVREALGPDDSCSLLKIAAYPPPLRQIRELVDHCDEVLVVEDGYPFIESKLRGLLGLPGKRILGKLSGELPATGELTADIVAAALGRPAPNGHPIPDDLAARPPALCQGCPHCDTFRAIMAAVTPFPRRRLYSDIGCYTLGFLPPYDAIDTCVDMGASIAMAHGAAQAGAFPVLCTIGDSTFTHSGMTGLLGAVRSNADMTVVILDNSTVGMTGGQQTMAHGEELVRILLGLGVDREHLTFLDPLPKKHEENVEKVTRAINHRGLSVLLAQRACIHALRKGVVPSKTAADKKAEAVPSA